jgi:outer membrane cobalamin receptor
MRKLALFLPLFLIAAAHASIFSQLHGVVHDPQHRPIAGARIELHAANSTFTQTALTGRDGTFTIPSLPLGDYTITVSQSGFSISRQAITIASDTAPILHIELALASVEQSTTVTTGGDEANVNTATPTTLISRETIAQTPGADRTNSMAMITDYVPGAYMTHDMLHIRGGHQVSWLIDGVQIPNTNIASNLGAQIDPKDIDYIEVQRGSYTADTGDRTYGVFNVVPRTGFERNRQAELVLSAGSFLQTNDQINLGDHTEKFAYYASLNGNRSDYGLAPPIAQTFHDATNGYGGFASLIYNRTPKDQFRLVTQLRTDFFQIPYDPDPNSFENQQYDSSGLRDSQH